MFKTLLQRITGHPSRSKARKPNRRALRMERLDKRTLLAADIGAIIGTTYIDLNGDGLEASDTRLSVDVSLFRDGGDGVFGGDDTLVQTVTSGSLVGPTPGQYRFDNLSPDLYFVDQAATVTPTGLVNPDPIPVTIATGSVRVEAIDTFDQTNVATLVSNATGVPDTFIGAAAEAIGGERNISIELTSASGSVTLDIQTVPNLLTVGSSSGTGASLIQYDGIDGTLTLSPTGLGGISLNDADPLAGFIVRVSTQPAVGDFEIIVYTDATNFSSATIAYPAGADPGPVDIFIPFSSFSIGAGAAGPADFNDVGAIEQLIDLELNQDVIVSLVESVRPESVTADLVNIQPLTIGNLVFQDNDSNGIFGAGDVGLAGVDVELYLLTAITDVVDPNTQLPVATTTTDSLGAYSFADLDPGFYSLVIPDYEFDASSAVAGALTLVGFSTSVPIPETAGADANVDNDDDGRAVGGELYIATAAFELISGNEPTGSGNTNNTFDFGFVATADLQLTKTFVSLTTLGDGTREATFRIDVVNNGPAGTSGITVVDSIPTGLTFDRVTSTTSTTAAPAGVTGSSVVGNQITLNLVDLASSAGTSFHIIATVNAGVFTDLTNSATVDGTQTDATPANNTDDALLDLPQTDLAITKTLETTTGSQIPPATTQTGDTVVYRLTVSNTGPDNATGVSVVDTLPAGVTFVSGTINGGTAGSGIAFNPTLRQVTATVGAVTTTTPAVILLTVTIDSDATDLISNTATVSNSPDTDGNTANDTASVNTSVARAVDLAVVKAISTAVGDNTTAVFGAPVTFVITVSNSATSPGDARGFTVTDTLPAGLTLVAGSFDAGTSGVTISNVGQNLTFTGGALDIGQSASFTFDALIAQTAGTTITNTAVVAPINNGTITDIDINSANNTEPETITPTRNVELVVTKDDNFAGATTATPGGNITYTIVVSNTGVSDAVNVSVLDTLPASVTATSITIGGSQVTDNNPDAGLLGFVIPSILAGAGNAVTVQVTAAIAATVTAASITNQVAVSGGGVGDLPAGNTASVTTPLAPVVDVQVVKTGPASATPGGTAITYNLAISNTGPSVATNVSVTDDMPAGVTIQSITLNGTVVTNTGTGGDVAFVIPTLLVGTGNTQNAIITVLVGPATTGSLSNTATVSATGDSTPGNNSSTITTTLNPVADVTVTKTVNTASTTPGGTLTYTLVVSNAGVSTAAGVTLVDVLPTGLTFTSGTGPSGQVLTATGQTVNVAVGSLAPAATATYTIIAAIGSTFTGSLVNPATVATTTSEGANALTNTASATTIVDPGNYSITGRVFRDRNNNGIVDGTDSGISDVTLRLRAGGSTTVVLTAFSDASGNYTFSNLSAGTYTVEEVQPSGFRDGLEQAGTGATPANTANDTLTVTIPLGSASATAFPNFNFADIELLSKRRFLASSET